MIQPNLSLGAAAALPRPQPASGAGHAPLVTRLQQSALFRDYRRAFEAITGLPLVLRAAGSLRAPLHGSTRVNEFCALITQTNPTCSACLHVQHRLEAEATLEPKTVQCHAGLSESAVPVRVGPAVLGYLQTGQVLHRQPTRRRFRRFTDQLQADGIRAIPRAWEPAYLRTRVVPAAHYQSIIRLLVIFADHLATASHRILIAEDATESAVITRGRRFIAEHHREQLSLGDVARASHMSASYFCTVFKQSTGFGFNDYLSRARVESAKLLLLNAHVRVSEAAFACGFQSLSQFNRVFRRIVGDTPSRYRAQVHEVRSPLAACPPPAMGRLPPSHRLLAAS